MLFISILSFTRPYTHRPFRERSCYTCASCSRNVVLHRSFGCVNYPPSFWLNTGPMSCASHRHRCLQARRPLDANWFDSSASSCPAMARMPFAPMERVGRSIGSSLAHQACYLQSPRRATPPNSSYTSMTEHALGSTFVFA